MRLRAFHLKRFDLRERYKKFVRLCKNPNTIALLLILSIAFILRIIALIQIKNTLYFDFPLWDERLYHNWATQIFNNTYNSSLPYKFAPLPAYLISIVYRIFSPDTYYIRLLNIVLGTLTCYIMFLSGKELKNNITGFICGIISALYKPFIFYSVVPLKTSLSLFTFALTLYFFLTVLNRSQCTKVLLLGIVAGLAINVRENTVVLIPPIAVFILWSGYKRGLSLHDLAALLAAYLIGLSISVGPFVYRNFRLSGELVLTSTQSGFNLYLGNHFENPTPYYSPVRFASSSPVEQGIHFSIEASRRTGRKLSDKEASAYWIGEVIKSVSEHPIAFLRKIGQKMLALLNRFEAGDHYNIDFMSQFLPLFKMPLFTSSVILPLGIASMTISAWSLRKVFYMLMIFLFYALTLVIFFINARYRLPLFIILILLSAIGIQNLYLYLVENRLYNFILYVILFSLFFKVGHLSFYGAGDMTAYYNTHAIILNHNNFEKEAITYWRKSSEANGTFSAFANLSLAGKYFSRKDFKRSAHYLGKIPETSFVASYKYELSGDLMLTKKNLGQAISSYQKSLEINSARRRPRIKLVKIFEKLDKKRALQERKALNYIASFYTGL